MAVYVSLSIGLKNRGKNEESKLVGMAAKSRYLIVASQIGRDEAMSRMKATKYWKQRYPDTDFWQETKRCLREDGVRFKGLD